MKRYTLKAPSVRTLKNTNGIAPPKLGAGGRTPPKLRVPPGCKARFSEQILLRLSILAVTLASSGSIAAAPVLAQAAARPPAGERQTEPQTLGADRSLVRGSLSVGQAVQIGLRENLMIRVAKADVGAAEAETRVMRSMTRPQLSANTYLTVGSSPNLLSTSPNVMPVNTLAVPSNGFADQNLTLMVPLYTGGRLRNQVRAASERQRAASADVAGVESETALAIKDAYYRTLLAVELVKVAQARVDASTELVRTTRAQFEAGKGIEASVQRVGAELADAQRDVTATQNQRAKSLLDLKAAMGVSLDSEIALSDPLMFAAPSGDLKASLAEAARIRPELLAARLRAGAAQAGVASVRGSQGPQVYGAAMADLFAPRAMSTNAGGTLGVVISLPLFDGGQRRAEVDRARAGQARAEAETQNIELRVSNEVRQAWLDRDTADQNYRTAQTAVQAVQAAYDVTLLRVQNQKAILVEQLDALTALIRARANLAQALYDHALATARLQRAIGRP